MSDSNKSRSSYELDDDEKMSLAQRMAERHKKGTSGVRGRASRAVFISLQKEIEGALQHWSARAVWDQLHYEEKFPWKYNQFLKLCREFDLVGKGTPKGEDSSSSTDEAADDGGDKTAGRPRGRRAFAPSSSRNDLSVVGDRDSDG